MNALLNTKMGLEMIKEFFSWLFGPYIKIRMKNAIGTDGVFRRKYFYIGLLWEFHTPGYWMLWYDAPIHNFSLGVITIYWHADIEVNSRETNER